MEWTEETDDAIQQSRQQQQQQLKEQNYLSPSSILKNVHKNDNIVNSGVSPENKSEHINHKVQTYLKNSNYILFLILLGYASYRSFLNTDNSKASEIVTFKNPMFWITFIIIIIQGFRSYNLVNTETGRCDNKNSEKPSDANHNNPFIDTILSKVNTFMILFFFMTFVYKILMVNMLTGRTGVDTTDKHMNHLYYIFVLSVFGEIIHYISFINKQPYILRVSTDIIWLIIIGISSWILYSLSRYEVVSLKGNKIDLYFILPLFFSLIIWTTRIVDRYMGHSFEKNITQSFSELFQKKTYNFRECSEYVPFTTLFDIHDTTTLYLKFIGGSWLFAFLYFVYEYEFMN